MMVDLLLDERAILDYLATVANTGESEPVSLKAMLGDGKANLPREEFDRADWERMTDLYFAVRNLLMMGLVDGVADDGGEHLNRFRITDEGHEALAFADESPERQQ